MNFGIINPVNYFIFSINQRIFSIINKSLKLNHYISDALIQQSRNILIQEVTLNNTIVLNQSSIQLTEMIV